MSEQRRISEEMQNAFVDGELDAAEWARVAEAMGRDETLRRTLCELRMTKELVQGAYASLPSAPRRAVRRARNNARWAIAASMLFALGGWFSHAWWTKAPELDPASAYTLGRFAATMDQNLVLVHVSNGERESLGRALDEVEDLLRAARESGRSIRIEIVANRHGIDLLRAGVSPHEARVTALRARYANLELVACGQTMQRLGERGERINLLPGIEVAPSALDEVVRRLQEGWVYVRA